MALATQTEPSNQSKRRILCIDGGGIRGTFPAAFLAEIEQHLENPVGSYFDLISGTSTGGIIAIALSLGHRASEIVNLYEQRGPEIFGDDRRTLVATISKPLRGVRRIFRNKYDSHNLRHALHELLRDRRLGDARTRLVIPAWNPVAQSVYVYKTAHHARFRTDYRARAVDAALATSAAPTYFRQHVTQRDVGLIDGGIWANNPSAIATVEAIAVLDWPRESLRVLSLGCLEEAYTTPRWSGLGTLGRKAVKLLMDGQSHGALGMARLLTGHAHDRNVFFRIDHKVPYNAYKLDDAKAIQELRGLGHSIGRDRLPIIESVFFDEPAEKFTPIYQINEARHGN